MKKFGDRPLALRSRAKLMAGLASYRQFVRFLAVGLVNAVFYYSAFAIVYIATDRPTLAVVLATGWGIFFNFFTTGRIVFRSRGWSALPSFVAAYGLALTLNIVLMELFLFAQVNVLQAQVICLPPVIATSFEIGVSVKSETIVVANVIPALGPSFGMAPAGM